MKALTEREIKAANISIQLYTNILYPYNMDFRWMVQNNHIKKCGVMVRYIDISQEIWGKDIDGIKVKTTHTKPNPVAGDMNQDSQRDAQDQENSVSHCRSIFYE